MPVHKHKKYVFLIKYEHKTFLIAFTPFCPFVPKEKSAKEAQKSSLNIFSHLLLSIKKIELSFL